MFSFAFVTRYAELSEGVFGARALDSQGLTQDDFRFYMIGVHFSLGDAIMTFTLRLVLGALVAVSSLPALAQDAIHRTQIQIAECRFDMDHSGSYETTYRPQSSNQDCPCYSASAPPRAASEPIWPVLGCGGTSLVGPITPLPPGTPVNPPNPGNPTNPGNPVAVANPANPGIPGNPATPGNPHAPVPPGAPLLCVGGNCSVGLAPPSQDDDGPISDCGPAADGQNQCSPNPTPPSDCTTYADVMYRPECRDSLPDVQELYEAALWESAPEQAALLDYCAANPAGCAATVGGNDAYVDTDADGVENSHDSHPTDSSQSSNWD